MDKFWTSQDWLAARAADSPKALALIEEDRAWTYAELDQLVGALGRMLVIEGVAAGDRVAVLLPNCLAYASLIHALIRVGAVLVPLNTRLNSAELQQQMARAHCAFLITTAAKASELAGFSTNSLRTVIVSERLEGLDLTASDSASAVGGSASRLQAIVFTSGTTGQPKGAMLTLDNHFYSAVASALRLGSLPQDRWLVSLPLYHVGGMAIVLRACLYGIAIVLISSVDSQSIAASIGEHGVSIVSLVPTMLHRLLSSPDGDVLPSLRLVLLGGGPASADLMARATVARVPVATTYGLTEAASQVATMPPREAAAKPGSAGRPLLFTSLRIVDDKGATAPTGNIGEIVVRGPGVFAGYIGDDVATAKTLRDGELFTGDLGYLDDDGDLWVVQRRTDLIVSGGENVYPAEVEHVLAQHPAVGEVCVVGLEDEEWGQRVGALLTLRYPASEGELLGFARSRLAGYKVPRVIAITGALPLTGSGKVSRPAVVAALQALEEPTP